MDIVFNTNLKPEFLSITDKDEEILWTEKPMFFPYAINGLLNGAFFLLFAIAWYVISSKVEDKINGVGLWWAMFPLGLLLFGFLGRLLSYPKTTYAFTNRRVIMRTGIIGIDFKVIDYDKISDMEVNVNLIDRLFGTGTIRFFSGRTETSEGNTTKLYDSWESVSNPYHIFKMVKQVSVDIKTDYNYPNALRPKFNNGYQTKYDRKW